MLASAAPERLEPTEIAEVLANEAPERLEPMITMKHPRAQTQAARGLTSQGYWTWQVDAAAISQRGTTPGRGRPRPGAR